jgi:chromate reductase, NAD(P)H dehydrogenase (quinone)
LEKKYLTKNRMMNNIVTIGGSTSKNSINKILAEYAGELLKNSVLTKVDLNDFEMPLFSVDVENERGFPKAAKDLNTIFENTDGFVISLAEHNGAYSAGFKNVYDWLSRIEGKVWRNKPMLLLSTSPGARGGISVLEIALSRFPHMGGNIIGSIVFPTFYENFKDGDIVNVELKVKLLNLVKEFENSL